MSDKKRMVAVTTTDNPYNPITQFDEWFAFDSGKGYGTCNYLDRVSFTNDSMTSDEYDEEIERAIDEIIKYGSDSDGTHTVHYKKVVAFE